MYTVGKATPEQKMRLQEEAQIPEQGRPLASQASFRTMRRPEGDREEKDILFPGGYLGDIRSWSLIFF